jgi:hypothetical protein
VEEVNAEVEVPSTNNIPSAAPSASTDEVDKW